MLGPLRVMLYVFGWTTRRRIVEAYELGATQDALARDSLLIRLAFTVLRFTIICMCVRSRFTIIADLFNLFDVLFRATVYI